MLMTSLSSGRERGSVEDDSKQDPPYSPLPRRSALCWCSRLGREEDSHTKCVYCMGFHHAFDSLIDSSVCVSCAVMSEHRLLARIRLLNTAVGGARRKDWHTSTVATTALSPAHPPDEGDFIPRGVALLHPDVEATLPKEDHEIPQQTGVPEEPRITQQPSTSEKDLSRSNIPPPPKPPNRWVNDGRLGYSDYGEEEDEAVWGKSEGGVTTVDGMYESGTMHA